MPGNVLALLSNELSFICELKHESVVLQQAAVNRKLSTLHLKAFELLFVFTG